MKYSGHSIPLNRHGKITLLMHLAFLWVFIGVILFLVLRLDLLGSSETYQTEATSFSTGVRTFTTLEGARCSDAGSTKSKIFWSCYPAAK